MQTAILNKQGGRKYNEDSCAHLELNSCLGCWVVADGLGGHGGGDVASNLVIETMLNTFKETATLETDTLQLQFSKAQKVIVDAQKSSLKLSKMQSTVATLIIHNNQALWGYIGDTRLYYFNNGQLQKQTKDHSVPQMLVNAGEITTSQIRNHEDRNRLLRSLGGSEPIKPNLEQEPIFIYPGDAFLLCTDGFWEYILENEMITYLKQTDSAQDWLDMMEVRLLEKVAERNDNYSAIAITIGDDNCQLSHSNNSILTKVLCKTQRFFKK